MHIPRLSEILVSLTAVLFVISASAFYQRINMVEGSPDFPKVVAHKDKSLLKKQVSEKFYQLQNEIDSVVKSQKTVQQKVQMIKKQIQHWTDWKATQGFVGASLEIEMDLYFKSMQVWTESSRFDQNRCADYMHQVLVNFEPQSEDQAVSPGVDRSFSVLKKLCG